MDVLHYYDNVKRMYTLAAVIVEPRFHPCIPLVLTEFSYVLGSAWSFIVFTGTLNYNWMNDQCEKYIGKKNKYEVKQLEYDNLSLNQYSQLLMSEWFWESIQAEHILIFQTDSLPLRNSPHKIDKFLQYYYVGAPWKQPDFCPGYQYAVGNGGLSLRRRSGCLAAVRSTTIPKTGPEDIFFATFFNENMDKYPSAPYQIAGQFSAETFIVDQHPWGIHKVWLNPDHMFLLKLSPALQEMYKYFSSIDPNLTNTVSPTYCIVNNGKSESVIDKSNNNSGIIIGVSVGISLLIIIVVIVVLVMGKK